MSWGGGMLFSNSKGTSKPLTTSLADIQTRFKDDRKGGRRREHVQQRDAPTLDSLFLSEDEHSPRGRIRH